MALQRRRRLMLLQSEAGSTSNGHAPDARVHDETTLAQTCLTGEQEAVALEIAREQLFHECQGRRGVHLLVELPGAAQPARLELDRPFLLIGRDAACDLRLDHPEVSPRHAYLQWVAGHLFCADLGSEAGLLPGKRTVKPQPWVESRPLQIGSCRMTLVGNEPPAAPAFNPLDRSPQLAAEFPQIRLKFEGVEQNDNQWPVDRPLTLIGRGTQCKLRLDHPDMPLVQASLMRTPSGCWLIDLAGRGTTLVNGRPVAFAPLDIGDAVQLGDFRVVVTAAAFGVMETKPSRAATPQPDKAIVELATRHRELLGELNHNLKDVQAYLNAELLDDAPQLKAALEEYVRLAQRHHREMTESLKPFAKPARQPASAR